MIVFFAHFSLPGWPLFSRCRLCRPLPNATLPIFRLTISHSAGCAIAQVGSRMMAWKKHQPRPRLFYIHARLIPASGWPVTHFTGYISTTHEAAAATNTLTEVIGLSTGQRRRAHGLSYTFLYDSDDLSFAAFMPITIRLQLSRRHHVVDNQSKFTHHDHHTFTVDTSMRDTSPSSPPASASLRHGSRADF